jgi:hypothetical protein
MSCKAAVLYTDINLSNRLKNEVLQRVKEERNILHTIQQTKAN